MQRITPDRPWPLHDVAAIRRLEHGAASGLPPHTLMQRAGLAVARLALAIAPHARTVWIACGPGNNGGDGFEAALHLRQWGTEPVVTWLGDEARMPEDARASLQRARAAGVVIPEPPPAQWDLAVDALLGIGAARAPEGAMRDLIVGMNAGSAPVLAIDMPTGLNADTGAAAGDAVRATHTLSLLALKPGLFTAAGRDCAGQVWFDDLGVAPDGAAATATLVAPPAEAARLHASHKGSYGDVAVIGGAPGMAGAALLAASAALHQGAGRVFVGLLDTDARGVAAAQLDLMLRAWDTLDLRGMAVACGCGGGEAIRPVLPKVLASARALVLDADALNAIAADPQLQDLLAARGRRGAATVLTPHPLEAARLLAVDTAAVQADRIARARELAKRFGCVVVLKGSGTIVTDGGVTRINATGNALLAIAGTGDVLAGMVAARLAGGEGPLEAASGAVYLHGLAADRWPGEVPLTASRLAAGGHGCPPYA
jgi:hydroxyethylthiazole kinase-like uncharacterized protein yjeF